MPTLYALIVASLSGRLVSHLLKGVLGPFVMILSFVVWVLAYQVTKRWLVSLKP